MKTSRWRIAAAAVVLAALAFFAIRLSPYYIRNYRLQRYVESVTANAENNGKSDDLLRSLMVEKANDLDLPVRPQNVRVKHSPDGLRIDIRYVVRVDLPVYTVDLHFYPGAGVK